MVDVLNYMIPNQTFSKNYHLVSPANPVYCYVQYYGPVSGMIWNIKNAQGFPWDGNYFNPHVILQTVTGVDSTPSNPNGSWTDPTLYKIFTNTTIIGSASGDPGIGWSPRNIRAQAIPQPDFLVSDSTYSTMQGSTILSTQNLGGPTVCQIQGPFQLQVGALGYLDCLVQTYSWGTMPSPTMEVNWYALGFGHVRWQEWTVQNVPGVTNDTNAHYQMTRDVLSDQVVAGGTPALIWPNPQWANPPVIP